MPRPTTAPPAGSTSATYARTRPLGDIRLDAERDGAHVRLTCPGAPQIGAMLSGATVLVTAKDSRAATSQLVLQTNAEAELPVAGLERGAAYELWSPSVQQRLQSDPAWTKRAKGGTWHAFASFVWEGQTSIALQLVRVTQDGD